MTDDYTEPTGRANVSAALAMANARLHDPVKDRTANAGNYGYRYLSLDTVMEIARPVLSECGLSLVQDVTVEGSTVKVSTALLHTSGEALTFGPMCGPTGKDYQGLGSAVTYLRRYSAMAALGLAAAEDDDDGATAPTRDDNPTETKRVVRGETKAPGDRMWGAKDGSATPKQIGMVRKLMGELGETEVTLNDYTTETLGFEMPRDGLDHLGKNAASTLIDALLSRQKNHSARIERVSHSDAAITDDPWATEGIPLPPEPEEPTW
jgi:hypothetical protein